MAPLDPAKQKLDLEVRQLGLELFQYDPAKLQYKVGLVHGQLAKELRKQAPRFFAKTAPFAPANLPNGPLPPPCACLSPPTPPAKAWTQHLNSATAGH
jgi:hypothetical protein